MDSLSFKRWLMSSVLALEGVIAFSQGPNVSVSEEKGQLTLRGNALAGEVTVLEASGNLVDWSPQQVSEDDSGAVVMWVGTDCIGSRFRRQRAVGIR